MELDEKLFLRFLSNGELASSLGEPTSFLGGESKAFCDPIDFEKGDPIVSVDPTELASKGEIGCFVGEACLEPVLDTEPF